MRSLNVALLILLGVASASGNEGPGSFSVPLHGSQYSAFEKPDPDRDFGNLALEILPTDPDHKDIPREDPVDPNFDPDSDDQSAVVKDIVGVKGEDGEEDGEFKLEETDGEETRSQTSSGSFLGILNPMEAKSALTDFWSEIQGQTREFTRNITPSMQTFARRMQAAGFPAPLVHGFREIELPTGSLLPPFVPDIPIAGPLNPATWSQEQINAILNPQLLNLMNPNTAANTVTEIPGLGRFSIAIPPVNVEFPWAGAVASGTTNLATSAVSLLPQSFPSFIKYERIPGDAPSHMNIPELGLLNPANAYENKRQLSVAGDILQNSFDRLNGIVTGSAASGMRPLFAPVSAAPASAAPASAAPASAAPASAAPASTGGLFGTGSSSPASASAPAGPIQAFLGNAGGGPFAGTFGGALDKLFNSPLQQTAEGGSQNIGQGQGILEPVFSMASGSGAGGIVRGILDRATRQST